MAPEWCFVCSRSKCNCRIQTTPFDSEFDNASRTARELTEQRIANRRIKPQAPNFRPPLQPIVENVLIRWMAKALTGGQK